MDNGTSYFGFCNYAVSEERFTRLSGEASSLLLEPIPPNPSSSCFLQIPTTAKNRHHIWRSVAKRPL